MDPAVETIRPGQDESGALARNTSMPTMRAAFSILPDAAQAEAELRFRYEGGEREGDGRQPHMTR